MLCAFFVQPLQGMVIKEYATFLENYPTTMICFVNDGSTDNLLGVLNLIKQDFPQQTCFFIEKIVEGRSCKAREYCNQNFSHGYLDADLATTLEEFKVCT
jgi:hypothetical protein